ncbi:thioesterase domain-containing protein [Tamilnaduibacter salinus]|uniref:Thioesterase n=1 Tax=Tamilnaduibacter salinus TaxID=1484056 RepID=A0A2A2I0I7_9GAMM|nr:YiiD C-terminal domain-containing protein [Tamilnaduibacter salinus]PAV25229.1 thioesterase [Tamilnaduibacter salinus]PVY75308.1 thioesterase domain-containing protein [Tamilnaduibacter salinus]
MTRLARFQERINTLIPLTRSLGVTLTAFSGRDIEVHAPLSLNHNHQGTGFGGSIYAVAVTAAWSLLELWVEDQGLEGEVVIQSGAIDYGQPLSGDLLARCSLPGAEDMQRFERSVDRRGIGRLCLESTVYSQDAAGATPAATFSGRFVVTVPRSQDQR